MNMNNRPPYNNYNQPPHNMGNRGGNTMGNNNMRGGYNQPPISSSYGHNYPPNYPPTSTTGPYPNYPLSNSSIPPSYNSSVPPSYAPNYDE